MAAKEGAKVRSPLGHKEAPVEEDNISIYTSEDTSQTRSLVDNLISTKGTTAPPRFLRQSFVADELPSVNLTPVKPIEKPSRKKPVSQIQKCNYKARTVSIVMRGCKIHLRNYIFAETERLPLLSSKETK
jgi:hypothetical protein